MTELGFIDFQRIYGGQVHETWVRKILAAPFERPVADVTRVNLELARATPLAGTNYSLGQALAKVAGKYRFNLPRGAVLLAYGKSTFGVSESTDAAYVQPTQR